MNSLSKKKKMFFSIIIFVGLSLLFFTLFKSHFQQQAKIIPITNSEVNKKLKDKNDIWLYVGRPSCDSCKVFYTDLKATIQKKKFDIFYYNTDKSRKENEKAMSELLNKLNVKTVPTLLHLKNGKIVKTIKNYQDTKDLDVQLK